MVFSGSKPLKSTCFSKLKVYKDHFKKSAIYEVVDGDLKNYFRITLLFTAIQNNKQGMRICNSSGVRCG